MKLNLNTIIIGIIVILAITSLGKLRLPNFGIPGASDPIVPTPQDLQGGIDFLQKPIKPY